MWNDIRDRLPDLIDGESEEVLCMTRKFGHGGTKDNTPYGYALLWWDGEKWEGWETDDFENNPDYVFVTHWMYIPDVQWK